MKSLINFVLPGTQTVTRNSIYRAREIQATQFYKETVSRFQSLINDVEEFFWQYVKYRAMSLSLGVQQDRKVMPEKNRNKKESHLL